MPSAGIQRTPENLPANQILFLNLEVLTDERPQSLYGFFDRKL